MVKYLQALLLAVLLGAHGVVNAADSLTPQFASDPEEYAVYAVVLKEMFKGKEAEQLVIERYTSFDDQTGNDPGQRLEQLIPLTTETADDFKSKNRQPSELSDAFGLKAVIHFLSRDEIKRMFESGNKEHGGWKSFRRKYPGVEWIITLSRVGFNPDKSQALIHVSYACPGLCGSGNYVLLTIKDGKWKVQRKQETWIN